MTNKQAINSDKMLQHATEAELYLKLLANKTRLMVLCTLLHKELSVTELLGTVDVSQPVISQHLAILRESELVATRRNGQTIYYRLADERVEHTIELLYQFFCSED